MTDPGENVASTIVKLEASNESLRRLEEQLTMKKEEIGVLRGNLIKSEARVDTLLEQSREKDSLIKELSNQLKELNDQLRTKDSQTISDKDKEKDFAVKMTKLEEELRQSREIVQRLEALMNETNAKLK